MSIKEQELNQWNEMKEEEKRAREVTTITIGEKRYCSLQEHINQPTEQVVRFASQGYG